MTKPNPPRPPRACAYCGEVFQPALRGPDPKLCSERCRVRWRRIGKPAATRSCVVCGAEIDLWERIEMTACVGCRVKRDAMNRQADPRQMELKRAANRRYRKAHPEQYGWTDSKKAAYHRRRARKKMGDGGERIVPADVFNRDGWRCGICRHAVNPDLAWPHPKSASLDHIVPLSKGGTHTTANVQCAHLDCNTKKHVNIGGAGDQLRLIG